MLLSSSRIVSSANNPIELVLIHGWGVSSTIWQHWTPTLKPYCNITLIDLPGFGLSEAAEGYSLDELLAAIVSVAPKKAVYVGYSLGGMLAAKVANQYAKRVSALITLASNKQFVASDDWPHAMEKDIYDAFYLSVKNNSSRALKRFSALQVGGVPNEKALLKLIRGNSESHDDKALLDTLNLLSDIDISQELECLSVPSLFVFSEKDQLVPVAAAKAIQAKYPENVVILDNSPHCCFVSHPKESWSAINAFLEDHSLNSIEATASSRVLSKQQVARSFGRAAKTYDSVAGLQRRVGETLLTYLPESLEDEAVVVDLGCGTGFFTPYLQQRFPVSSVLGLDLAEGMVNHASKYHDANAWLCADAEDLPFANNAVDVIFSSLAIQWCEDSDSLFSEIFRVLKPGGCFVFSTLGPNTLHELRTAWTAVDDYVHVNRFLPQRQLSTAAKAAGFILADNGLGLEEETITLEYSALKQLTRELKCLGAHNVNQGRPSGLTGKKRLMQLSSAYELQRNDNHLLPASYQTWYGVLTKPIE